MMTKTTLTAITMPIPNTNTTMAKQTDVQSSTHSICLFIYLFIYEIYFGGFGVLYCVVYIYINIVVLENIPSP